jgi:hypothetical protein
MPLLEHGFLGAEGDKTRQEILKKYADLFTLLKDLNDISHEYLRRLELNPRNRSHWFAATWFIRGMMTFQSVLLLLERGCIEDASALCRTLLQAYIRLAAIAADPRVINRILATAFSDQRKRLGFYKTRRLKLSSNAAPVNLDALIAKKDAEIQKLGGATITEYELITIGKTEEDYATYLRLSDAAHTSPNDMQSILKFDKKGNFLGYIYGPHDRDLATFAVHAAKLQSNNLINTNKVIKGELPASFTDFQNRRIRLRSDMPGIFNPQMSVETEEIAVAAQPKSSAKKSPKGQ